MTDKKFENALLEKLSGCHMDPAKLRLHVKEIVEIQKGKIDVVDAFPLGEIAPNDVGILTRAKFEQIPGLLGQLSKSRLIAQIQLFPYGIIAPDHWDVKIRFSDRPQNRF